MEEKHYKRYKELVLDTATERQELMVQLTEYMAANRALMEKNAAMFDKLIEKDNLITHLESTIEYLTTVDNAVDEG